MGQGKRRRGRLSAAPGTGHREGRAALCARTRLKSHVMGLRLAGAEARTGGHALAAPAGPA